MATQNDELLDIVNIVELDLPKEISNVRNLKTLGKFYSILYKFDPLPLYCNEYKDYHIDYLVHLLDLKDAFIEEDYQEVLHVLKDILKKYPNYILQGRMYYNILKMFEIHIPNSLTEFISPVELRMREISEPNIFEYRINNNDKEILKKYFHKTLRPINEVKSKSEFNRFQEILKNTIKKCKTENKETYIKTIYNFIRTDIKTDPLTLVMFYKDLSGQYQTLKIIREDGYPYNALKHFKTDGYFSYYPPDKPYHEIKDFRVAMMVNISEIT